MTPQRRRVFFAAALAAWGGAAVVVSCGRDATGPGAHLRARLAIAPVFADPGGALVDFASVRVTVVRTGGGPIETAGRTAVDTVISFPTDADSLELALRVPLDAPTEEFLLYIRLITATGDTVFRNEPYPQRIVVEAARTSAPLDAVLTYVGVGFDAATLVITPPDTVVAFGGTVDLAAVALGTDQKPIPGTPIEWISLDPTLATVPAAAAGRVVGGTQRGAARIVARTPTGLADTVTVTVQPLPAVLAAVAGDTQQALPGGTLAKPLRVRVTGADGLGVSVPVQFSAPAGATVAPAVVMSDAQGFAETGATLAPVLGTQLFTASVPGLLPAVFTAQAVSPVAQVIVSPSAPAVLAALGQTQQFTAQALDAANNPIATTIAWTSSDPAVATVDASGLATAVGNGTATITATALGVSGSSSLNILQRVVALVFATQPSNVVAGVPISPAVRVAALDAGGSVARNFTSGVTLSPADSIACGATLLGTTTVPAVAGVATFDAVKLEVACPGLQLRATADTFTSSRSTPFTVLPGPAAKIVAASVTTFTDTVKAILGQPLVVRVTDQFGNGVSGYPVTWATTPGTLTPVSPTTDGSGFASGQWQLGTVAGTQAAQASAGALAGSPVAFTATVGPGTATQLAFVAQPTNALVGVVIAPVEVAIHDQFGNRVATWPSSVGLQLGPTSPLGATLLGKTSVSPIDGLASFGDLIVNLPGLYTLVASSGGLTPLESQPFVLSLAPSVVFAGDSTDGVLFSNSGVFRVNPDGLDRFRLNDRGKVGDVHPRSSPDRQRVAFTFVDQVGGPNKLFVVARTGDTLAMLVSDTSARRARWSPDGKNLAFACGDGSSPGQDVCVIPDVTGSITSLNDASTRKIFVTDFNADRINAPGAGAFAWNPDSRTLIVARDTVTDKAEPVSRLYLVTFNGTLVAALTASLVDPETLVPLKIVSTLDLSADGATIVFAAQDQPTPTAQRLYAIGQDGKGLRRLTKGPAFDYEPVISPDGRQVLFLRKDLGCVDYWRVGIDGTGETQVSAEGFSCDINEGVLGHDWSPDGKDIVVVGSDLFGNLGIYRLLAGTTAATYDTRVLIGRGANPLAYVRDIQPSWRP